MRLIPASDDLPPEGILKWCYSEVHERYFAAKWSASRGWLDQNNCSLSIITHWFDLELPTPLPISDTINKEIAVKYGFDIMRDY